MTNGKRKYLSCKKDCHVSLKLSEEDFMKLESDAKSAGMDRSKYLRALIQNAKGIDPTFAADRAQLIRKVSGVSNNVNQMAHLANAQGQIYFSAIEDARQEVVKLQNILKEVLDVWQLRKSCT